MKMFAVISGIGKDIDTGPELSGYDILHDVDLTAEEVDEMFELKVGDKLVLDADLTIKRVS